MSSEQCELQRTLHLQAPWNKAFGNVSGSGSWHDAVTLEARTKWCATVPLCIGGLAIRSAEQSYPAAHRAIWADGIEMDQQRHPSVAATVKSALGEQQ